MAKPQAHPRRSVLYMPGSNPRALEKAKTIAADALIFDLEDAVAPDAKEEARANVTAATKAGGYGLREVVIRVNGFSTPWGADDVKAAVAAGPDAILVPKIASPDDVAAAEAALKEAGAADDLALWCMIETPKALLSINEIGAMAERPGARMTAWVMGTNDIAKELKAQHTPDRTPMMASLGLSLLGAKAYGLAILDGVYNDIADEVGFRAVCQQGADMGFDGKTLIHPSQVAPCNDIFSPKPDEVAFSRAVLDAFDAPENRGKGVLKVEGRMVELLHAEIARDTVAIADAIEALEAASS